MARPIEFDKQKVLNKAMEVFWRRGFEATSLRDLEEATALHRGSLYAAFGSKRDLFFQALSAYEQEFSKIQKILDEAPSALEGIENHMIRVMEESLQDNIGYGCFMGNTALELTAHDREIVDRVRQMFQQVESIFSNALLRAQKNGELSESQDPTCLAHFIVSTLSGLRLTAQTRPGREALENIVNTAMKALRSP